MGSRAWGTAVFVCQVLASTAVLAAIPSSERAVLVTVYDTTNGASWSRKAGWKGAPGTECSWYGVLCDNGQSTVIGLDLSWNNVAGPIPPAIKNLANLESFDVTANPLTGTFPNELTQLPKLKVLRLGQFYGGPLGGTINPAIANLLNLEELDLSGNQLTGSIPAGVATLPKLRVLDLRYNHLSGSIPPALFARASMVQLFLAVNELGGSIPAALSMPELLELELSENQLTGGIPQAIGNLPKIRTLYLNNNGLTGAIPAALGQLKTLEQLRLYSNQLTGGLPTELGELTNLTYLDVGDNPITGPIPASIGNLQKLTFLSTYVSTLSGPIPDSLFDLPELQTLYLTGNAYDGNSTTKLSGRLSDFTRLTKLKALDVAAQDIVGPIPPAIAQLTALESFNAAYNPIGGSIPQELGELSKLGSLELGSTGLSGPIPESFGQLAALHTLGLSRNALTSLPASFSSLKALEYLVFGGNELTGTIPAAIAELPVLQYLELRENKLSGPIPPVLFTMPKLTYIDLDDNRLSGPIPSLAGLKDLEVLRMRQNELSGTIPGDITLQTSLAYLDLSYNRLSGPIPPLGTLTALRFLYLHNNELTGTIPDLSSLDSLEELYVSGNRLKGPIPPTVGSLVSLRRAGFGYNAFSGAIPREIANCTSLADSGLELTYNTLFNEDASIEPFLARTAPGFEQSQTVAPSNVAVSAARARSLVLSWSAIEFLGYSGGYQIAVASSPNGPFTTVVTTPDKFTTTFTLDGLVPSTDYYVRISTATYASSDNRNTLVSDPSPVVAARTTEGTAVPASVVLLSLGGELYQEAGRGGGYDSYTLANVGDVATTITLAKEGDFFTQSPASFVIAPGAVYSVDLNGLARPAGVYTGASIPSGAGVPTGFRVPVRLFSTAPVEGTVNAVANTNRVDVSAEAATTSLPASVSFTNTGNATLTGVFVTEAPWIAPPAGIVTIAAGQTLEVNFTVDRTKRADAATLSGTAMSSLALVYPTGSAQGARSTHNGSSTGTSLVTVVDTVKPTTSSVSIPPLADGEVSFFVPGVGHVGSGSELFVSDFSVLNAFGTTALGDIRLYFTPAAGPSAVTSLTNASAVSPGQSFGLADVVKNAFNANEFGTIQVRSLGWNSLVVTSNLLNASGPYGSLGTTIPVLRNDRSIGDGSSLVLNGLRNDSAAKTNLVIQETSGALAKADLSFFDASGAAVPAATSSVEVPPFQLVRLVDAVPPGAVRARISVQDGSSGQLDAYATPIDRTSGDLWSLADWGQVFDYDGNETVVVPAVGKVHGVNGAFFRSDVSISAKGGEPATAGLKLYYDQGLRSAEASVDLEAGETRVLEDVIGSRFPALAEPVVGYLVVEPSSGEIAVSSRTWATQDGVGGTFGTSVPALPLSRAIRLGQKKVIGGLDIASDDTTGARTPATYRTNLLLVEASGAPASVRLTVVYADRGQLAFGSRLINKTIDLAANGFYLRNLAQLIAESNPGVGDLRAVQVELRVIDGDGAVFAFTSSVDNGTADQVLRVD